MKVQLNNIPKKENTLSKEDYKVELKKLQYHLLSLQLTLRNQQVGLIFVFEGMDAAGKGGAIKRLTERLDPRGFIVHPISAPRPHEKRYHYMHRFWRKLPMHGQISIFDRSWYGRVLVERIEKFATKQQWKRAYNEINEFERLLSDEDYILVKYWLQISNDEQLSRFIKRKNDPFKQWKLTDEDWRNRDKWDQYVEAAQDMLEKTDSEHAPWFVVAADDKKHARLQVLKKAIDTIEAELSRRGIEFPPIHDKELSQIIGE
ncbi:hypothetical protein LG275_02685 [Chryseomicrobium palamuruense]